MAGTVPNSPGLYLCFTATLFFDLQRRLERFPLEGFLCLGTTMSGRLRPLLAGPDPNGPYPSESSGQKYPDPSDGQLPRRKRDAVAVACQSCRVKRIKCDGTRPSCSACIVRAVECHYDRNDNETVLDAAKRDGEAWKAQYQQLARLVDHLATASEEIALAALRQLRGGVDIEDILQSIDAALDRGDVTPASAQEEPTQEDLVLQAIWKGDPSALSETLFKG